MQKLVLAIYPAWLVSSLLQGEVNSSATRTENTIDPVVNPLNHMKLVAEQPRPLSLSSTPFTSADPLGLGCTRPACVIAQRPCSLKDMDKSSSSKPVPATRSGRVAVPLPFSSDCIASTISLSSRGRPGVSLAEWAKLSEKKKTYIAIEDPHESLHELFLSERRVLFQSHWPGYDARTCYLDMPAHAIEGDRAFTRVNLLDMICSTLVDWVVKVTNDRHIECREPRWAIGLKQITFKHIFVVSVVEVKGYVSKWVPVLEIDPQTFQSQL